MIKCASVFTYEMDDPDLALEEINRQLADKITLLDNTVGIIMCHAEFTMTDALSHICKNLPFDVVGVTTASQAVNGEVGELILTLFIITSDDTVFRAGLTGPVDSDVLGPTGAAYEKASAGMEGKPKLALVFPPLLLHYAGDVYPEAWAKIAPGTPIFGTLAIDDTVDFSLSETIFCGEHYTDRMVFVLCYGGINPRFLVGTTPEENMMPYKAEITSAEGPYVHEINNISALDYFEQIGLASRGADANNFLFVPVHIDLKNRPDYDGVAVMRVLTQFTEDGSAIFRGSADTDSVFGLSQFSEQSAIDNTATVTKEILKMDDVNGILSFSCIIRRMAMQSDVLYESRRFAEILGDGVPFMFGYSGGELCPTSVRDNVPTNRFHNYTLINLII